MNVQTLGPATVEIETLGAWRLDGREIVPGTQLAVLPSLASDLVMRGKARRVVASAVAPAVAPAPAPDIKTATETPPAPAVPVSGKK